MNALMSKSVGEARSSQGVRSGTARRRAGRETAARIVQAAHDLLESENLDRFSMRAVAEQAGVSLANLQYYFPGREDLAQALSLDLDARYRAAYEERLAVAGDSPIERFRAVMQYNMEDIARQTTRRFFIQLWALMGSLDEFEGHYIGQVYKVDIGQLSEHIAALHPELSAAEITRRATLTAAMIEGLLVVINTIESEKERETILEYAMTMGTAIADGRMLQD